MLTVIFPENGLLGSVGVKLKTVVPASIPAPDIGLPTTIPPFKLSMAILLPEAPGV